MRLDSTASPGFPGAVPRRALGAAGCIVVAMALLSVQDYFDEWSLYFTAAYIALTAGALLLVLLTPSNPLDEGSAAAAAEPVRSRWAAAALSSAWTAGCAILGRYPQVHSGALIGGAVLAGGILSATLLVLRRGTRQAAALPALASYILMISSPVLYMDHEIYPYRGTLMEVVTMGSYIAVAAPALVRMPPYAALGLYIAAGTALRALGIHQWELDPAHRDMIPMIHYGAISFLRGHNPYRLYWCGHDLPMTYLPLMWLAYVPAVLAGVEPRIISLVLSAAAVIVMVLWKGRSRGCEDFVLYLCAVWFFQMEGMWVAIFAESAPFWVLAFLFLWAVLRERRAAAAIFLGLMLSARHFSLLFFPYAALWMLAGRGGERKFDPGRLVYPLLSITIPCFILLPFAAGNAQGFFFGTLHWFTRFGITHKNWWDLQISLAPLFYSIREERMLPWIQGMSFLSIFVLLLILAARRKFSPVYLRGTQWPLLAVGYVVFLLFNSLLWRHLHLMGIALFFFAILARVLPTARGAAAERAGFERFFERVFVAGRLRAAAPALLLAAIAAGGVVLGRSFYGFLDRRGMVKDAAAVTRDLRPGDLLVDYVYLNAWPILEGTPFDTARIPRDVMHSLRLRSQVPALFKRAVIVSSGSHFVVPDDVRDLVGYMEPNPPRRVGSLKVYVFDNPLAGDLTGKLSDHVEWIQSVSLAEGGRLLKAQKADEAFSFPDLDPRYMVGVLNLDILLADRACVLVHPPTSATMRVDVKIPFDGRLWLQTALADRAIWPGLAPVDVKVRLGGKERMISHPNDQGFYVWHLGPFTRGEPISVRVSSERKKQRFFCFDLLTTAP
jgi:hypothetical protein